LYTFNCENMFNILLLYIYSKLRITKIEPSKVYNFNLPTVNTIRNIAILNICLQNT